MSLLSSKLMPILPFAQEDGAEHPFLLDFGHAR